MESLEYSKGTKLEKTITDIKKGSYVLEMIVEFLIADALDENGEEIGLERSREYMKKFGIDKDISKMYYDNPAYSERRGNINLYERYIDSETMHFDGDIIITDPCYVVKDNDRDKCNGGYNMETLGLNCITHDTLYGDWGCGVFNMNRKKPNRIGSFCADAGMVGVFDKLEIDKYNPSFSETYLTKDGWCACLIEDFCGDVTIKVIEVPYKGDFDYEVIVVGDGINTKTKRPIRFESRQTGF